MEPLKDAGKYDSAFLGILQSVGKIEPFMDHIFSFLRTRTDFYVITNPENPKMGFAPGVAESIVQTVCILLHTDYTCACYFQAFKKHEILARKAETEKLRQEATRQANRMGFEDQEVAAVDDTPVVKDTANEIEKEVPPAAESKLTSAGAAKEKPLTTTKATPIVDESWNGAVRDNYTWSQTLTDLDLRVIVPKGTTAKDLKIDITTSHLKVILLNTRDQENPGPRTVIEGEFTRKVIPSQSMWSIEKATSVVHINLEKPQEVMWKSVLKGEPEIDLTKVDTTRNMEDFDPETQAAIQRVTYDHHQKLQGKPTSQQKQQQVKRFPIK